MFIKQIKVKDFKVLKDVDLSFDQNFPTKIFPVGSTNGGGKSTLLQLIFILLHCSTNQKKIQYLKNLMKGYGVAKDKSLQEILFLDIYDEEIKSNVTLTFYACNSNFLKPLKEKLDEKYASEILFSSISNAEFFNLKIEPLEKSIKRISSLLTEIKIIGAIENKEEQVRQIRSFQRELRELRELDIRKVDRPDRITRDVFDVFSSEREKDVSLGIIEKTLEKEIEERNGKLKKFKVEHETYSYISYEVLQFIKENKLTYITYYSASAANQDNSLENVNAIICKIESENDSINENPKDYLEKLSNQVYLAAPSTQVFQFLNTDNQKTLFKKPKPVSSENYLSILDSTKANLKGLFTYDFLALDYILESFKNARDQDFKVAVEGSGEYGNNYKNLLQSLNQILDGKTLALDLDNLDISGVSFKLNGTNLNLLPENLSHGELKRLSIFMWLKYRNIQNALVLMDEIEISLHPDWQYQIVKDLEQWGSGNQYILATHSYQLCEAVTPKHVKELSPVITFNKKIEQYGL